MSLKAPKASLKSFQEEIDNIHQRETTKQRVQALAAAATERQSSKKHKDEKVLERKTKDEKDSERKTKDPEVHSVLQLSRVIEFDDYNIQPWLLSNTESDYEKARDALAGRLTRNKGEYIIRFGCHPTRSHLFDIEEKESLKAISTEPCNASDLKLIEARLLVVAEEIGAKVSTLFISYDSNPRATYLLRFPPTSVQLTSEVRCAVVGNVDSGKSTTLGVLTRGGLDDGRGRARVGLFRHKHEIETGRTSSILGYSAEGTPILPTTHFSNDINVIRREKLGWDEISRKSAKIVSFIDLAGHERYLKTTLYGTVGLTSGAPSLVILMIAGNAGLIGMSKEHLAITLALNVPVVIDMTPANILEETIKQAVRILKSPGCRKTPVFVRSMETVIEISQLRTFLNLLPSSEADDAKYPVDQPLEVKIGDPILIGPDSNGNFMSSAVKDIHRKRAPVKSAEAGQCVSLALKRIRRAAIRRGEHPLRIDPVGIDV
ncbi:hypothetical protein Clacol_000694 [Clathrus columnatus]|uniref:Tr-type G domain-containing protein n=1 Tax=Clathrus columnatus TaxID=1419009 RepID=A0AAV4ZZ16_9AGAM|nr:hypothetical protein Clacol_000694 [Clathrus columnatus]